MLKELTTKFLVVIFLFSMIFSNVNALEVSAFKAEDDSEATVTFCKTLQIENVSINKTSVIQTIVFEKDDGKFENIALLNDAISTKIISCFEGVCDLRTSCNKVPYKLISAKKSGNADLIIAKVSFDDDLSAIFLISKYQKKNKTLYRVTMPKDLKFLSGKYKRNFRDWLIQETKNLL